MSAICWLRSGYHLAICWLDGGYALMCVGIKFAGLRTQRLHFTQWLVVSRLCGSNTAILWPTLMSRAKRLNPRRIASQIDLPCRPIVSARLDACRRMVFVHLAVAERRLHPIYSCCTTIMASDEGREALSGLQG